MEIVEKVKRGLRVARSTVLKVAREKDYETAVKIVFDSASCLYLS